MKNSYFESPFAIQRLVREPEVHIYSVSERGCGQYHQNSSPRGISYTVPDENERIEAAVAEAVKAEFLKIREIALRNQREPNRRKNRFSRGN